MDSGGFIAEPRMVDQPEGGDAGEVGAWDVGERVEGGESVEGAEEEGDE